jgi:hypothetical protein
MDTFVAYFVLLLIVIAIIAPIYDIIRSKALTKRERVNYVFLVSVLPILGFFIYFGLLRKSKKFVKY